MHFILKKGLSLQCITETKAQRTFELCETNPISSGRGFACSAPSRQTSRSSDCSFMVTLKQKDKNVLTKRDLINNVLTFPNLMKQSNDQEEQ